jgi:peptidoglycan glycosyltransferase
LRFSGEQGHGFRWRKLGGLLIVVAIGAGVFVWREQVQAREDRHEAAVRFVRAWERQDYAAMWHTLTPEARAAHSERTFAASYRSADRSAGVESVRARDVGGEHGGKVSIPVAIGLGDLGVLRGALGLPLAGRGTDAGVDWKPALRLPGLRPGEAVRRQAGRAPRHGQIFAADGTPLAATGAGAALAGVLEPKPTGLAHLYEDRVAGHPSQRLLFGKRVIAHTRAVNGRSLHTTLRPGLMGAAQAALGSRLGGVAVVRPSDGAIQALAGLAVSAPQPPGSTFKIITTSAALEHRIATPSTTYPVATAATLSGVKLGNAGGESCGGTLTQAFVQSCNSVFAPLGAKVGAKRLVQAARTFGFGESPRVPAAKPSMIAPPSRLKDDLAVGAAAIGQDRDLATPLEMATVGATIALDGQRARPRIATIEPVLRRRAISATTAREVRSMMIDVVSSGTGTAAAIPGLQVAGKTGTAELRPNSKNPKDADAWFVAFAPAMHPKVAVAVMLVGAGFGGTAAAPIAQQVLTAALNNGSG